MDDKNTYSVDKYLEIIAEKEGITKEEVQQEIGRARPFQVLCKR